jgi:RNA polymerase sigma-70 factor, ECF subfamily
VTALAAAKAGDEQAFVALTSPHSRRLHLHCYRMLGSLHDADDALQETMLRAWKGLARFEPRAELSTWLYRIATNVCLRRAEQRAREPVPVDTYLQPYPDLLLDGLAGPEAEAERREDVGIAFVAALQLLPPKQRAVLVLRDALDWPAKEVAALLDVTVPAVNSALQRARERLERGRRAGTLLHPHADDAASPTVVRRFVAAWDDVDVDAIVELLTDDALMTMPPVPVRVDGPAAIGAFFRTVPADGDLRRIRLVPTAANRQPALAAYFDDADDGTFTAYGLMVLALRDGRIAGITGFAEVGEVFLRLGLPERPGD